MNPEQLELDFKAPLLSLPQLWTPDDIYKTCTAETLQAFGEDARVERKLATISQKLLSEYASMWANSQPFGGLMLLGVNNKGEFVGCRKIEQSHINDLHAVRTLCPDARFEFSRVPVTNVSGEDDFIEVMRVYYREDKLVETTFGQAFIREGERKRRLTEEEKREIRLNKGELDLEAEKSVLRFPDEFNSDLLNEYRTKYVEKRQLNNRYSIEDVLDLSKLGKRTHRGFDPNLGCTLLFAKDPRIVVPGAYIRVLRYDGVEEQFGSKLNIIADRQIDGPLPLQISLAEEFISSQIRNFTRLGRDGRFATKPEFPKDVWLEAVVNAVVHRSYNLKNMNIFVKMFEDKLVVESPGAFLPPTTAETVFDGGVTKDT